MKTIIINSETRTLNYSMSITRPCSMCTDGNARVYALKCKDCKGHGRLLSPSGRRLRCKTCGGDGYVHIAEPVVVGVCQYCAGTTRVPVSSTDNMFPEDKEWYFENLFDFNTEYSGVHSSFNEGYLGLNIIAGVTDYGRHLDMTDEEFKAEVKKNFMDGFLQYCSASKSSVLPKTVQIRRGKTGWFAYPIY